MAEPYYRVITLEVMMVGTWNHWVSYATAYFGRKPHKDFLMGQWKILKRCQEVGHVGPCNAEAHDLTCDYALKMLYLWRV
jgi:hypothetical protein